MPQFISHQTNLDPNSNLYIYLDSPYEGLNLQPRLWVYVCERMLASDVGGGICVWEEQNGL